MIQKKKYRDWDHLKDHQGNCFRVVGSLHPHSGVHVQWQPDEFSSETPPFPSSQFFQSANFNPPPIMEIPYDEIQSVISPLETFQAILFIVEQGSFEQRRQLSVKERETIEAGLSISHKYQVDIHAIGVTDGVIIPEQPNTSEIHLVVYGHANAKKIVAAPFRLSSTGSGLRSLMKIEIFPEAEQLALNTGQSLEDCFHMLYYRYDQFYLHNRPIHLSFVPNFTDIAHFRSYDKNSIVESTTFSVKITATISEDAWGCFYPYFYEIADVTILEHNPISKSPNFPHAPSITRLVILDHEVFGYYQKGDLIEAMGSLQYCKNLLRSTTSTQSATYQVILGGPESYEGEYVLPQNERKE
jgi:predicted nucleotidyltransferase